MRGFENRYELAHLISCRLMGTITPEEEERFQKWWKESESHEKEYEMVASFRLVVVVIVFYEERSIRICIKPGRECGANFPVRGGYSGPGIRGLLFVPE